VPQFSDKRRDGTDAQRFADPDQTGADFWGGGRAAAHYSPVPCSLSMIYAEICRYLDDFKLYNRFFDARRKSDIRSIKSSSVAIGLPGLDAASATHWSQA